MTTIILLSLAGAVLSAAIGTLWYSDKTPMGKIHLRSVGFDTLSEEERKRKMEEAKPMMPKMYAGQLLLSFLTSFAVVFIIVMSVRNGVSFPMAVGFAVFNWLAFMVPAIGSGIIWGNGDRKIAWQKFFSDSLSNLVTILLIALLAGLLV